MELSQTNPVLLFNVDNLKELLGGSIKQKNGVNRQSKRKPSEIDNIFSRIIKEETGEYIPAKRLVKCLIFQIL
jgi:hypothetical protein